jgi:2-enoate reductase
MGGFTVYENNGAFNSNGYDYFIERARGGFGLIFSGALAPDMEVDPFFPQYSTSPAYSPNNFKRTALFLNERMSAYNAKMFTQVTMGFGRNYPGLHAPSELPVFWAPEMKTPELTKEQIKKKIDSMVQAAALMKDSGFAGVEVHAMHWGYLLDQFAMSLTNKRTDEYGGTLENRMRCAKEVVEGIKQVCGSDYPVTMRLALKSYVKGFNQASLSGDDEAGRTLEEGVKISKLLESYGYDALNVDAGIYDSFYYAAPPIYMPEGFMFDLAEEAKAAVDIPILTGGCRLVDPVLCEAAIEDGKTDAVVLARASLADPHLPKKVEMGRPDKIRPCIGCNQGCMLPLLTGGDASCAVNPAASREGFYSISKSQQPKNVVVVGGGAAGMELARTAKIRGHNVSLYEKSGQLGGNLLTAGAHSYKNVILQLNSWYRQELKDLDVPVYLNTELDADAIKGKNPDIVVLSVGAVPVVPNISGIDDPKVITGVDALVGKRSIGENTVIIGGGLVGCEIAIDYAKEGKKVTIVEALDSILSAGEPVPLPNLMMLNDLIAHYKVNVITGNRLESVNEKGVVIAPSNGGESQEIPADTVILAVGFKPVPSIASDLYESGIEVHEVGDGRKAGNIKTAICEAYEIARLI